MSSDFYNAPPQGFVRESGGWLRVAKTPHAAVAKKLKAENKELKSRLDSIEIILRKLELDRS